MTYPRSVVEGGAAGGAAQDGQPDVTGRDADNGVPAARITTAGIGLP
jgi:hypothetical protein